MSRGVDDELFMLKAENDSFRYEIGILREEMHHMWTTILALSGLTIITLVGSGLGWW